VIETPRTIEDYTRLLEERTPFTHTNIGGDGEFLTITGWRGTNSDGRQSTPEKAEALARVILEPRSTLHGYNPGKRGKPKLQAAEAWLREHGVNVPDRGPTYLSDPEYGSAKVNVRWVHKEIISSANVQGRLGPFLAALKARPLFVVGSTDISDEFLERLGALGSFLLAPSEGWDWLDGAESMIRARLSQAPPDTVVTWSLGYLSKVLQWRLIPDFPHLTQIDMGACWDAYCGVHNRRGYREPGWPKAMRRNLKYLEGLT
jgi:hypothetical protein